MKIQLPFVFVVFFVCGLVWMMGCSNSEGPTMPEGITGLTDISASQQLSKPTVKYLPFKAQLKGEFAVQADLPGCSGLPTLSCNGTGTGTHLGRFILVSTHCGHPENPLGYKKGEFEWIGANGDILSGTYAEEDYVYLIPTDDPSIFLVEHDYVIIGGTGRFENATGEGTATGNLTILNWEPLGGSFTLNFIGIVSSVGSSKQ